MSKKLHYLVIGEIGSRDWMHSAHGRKIEKAMEYNDGGTTIHILSELNYCLKTWDYYPETMKLRRNS